MQIEWTDIRIGDTIAVEQELYQWIVLIDWMNFLNELPNTPSMPGGAQCIISKVTEAITTPAFRKACEAQHSEASEHPLLRIFRAHLGDNGPELEELEPE